MLESRPPSPCGKSLAARSNGPCLPCLSYQRKCEQDFQAARVFQAAGASVSTTAPFKNGPIEAVLPVDTGAL